MSNELESFKASGEIVQKSILDLIDTYEWSVNDDTLKSYNELKISQYGAPKTLNYSSRIFDLNMYIEFRKQDRDSTTAETGRSWPENLSRKETALCKINMIKTLYHLCAISQDGSYRDQDHTHANVISYTKRMIDDIERSVYKWQWNKDKPSEKWPGLDPAAAIILNTLYKSFKKSLSLN